MKTTPDNRYIVPWPPVVWVAPISGKVYAGSGGTQIEVPAGTTRRRQPEKILKSSFAGAQKPESIGIPTTPTT